MVAVPLEVLICVSGLSVNFGLQASITFGYNQCVQKWYGPVSPGVLSCKLDVVVKRVYVMEKFFFMLCF